MTPSPTRKALREFAVIVGGVLVALWIDAGWSWLQDRQDEAELIADLTADFEYNREELVRVMAVQDSIRTASRRFVVGGPEVFGDEPSDRVIPSLFLIETFNPRTGALDSAIASGRIELLQNRDLRAALAAWPGYLSDAQEELGWVMDIVMSLGQAVIPPVMREEPIPETLAHVWADDDLVAMVGTKAAALQEVAPDNDALLEKTDEILALLHEAER